MLTDAELREELLGDPPPTPGADRITAEERFVISHAVVLAALLPRHVAAHRGLLELTALEGITVSAQQIARESAFELGAVLGSLARRADLVAAAEGSPVDPVLAMRVAEQVHFSCAVLLGAGTDGMSDDDARTMMLSLEELDELLALPGLAEWFAALGAPMPDLT